ncbi:MAG: sugar-binding transcriptional regulator [Chloroflexota bacterium]|nr:sugar-binding transcriptional regulator [Chloroflexota bacterium]
MTQESEDIYLLAEVASLYYEENYNQEQIAKMIGVSRSGISRLLTRSRELGLVDIHVHQPLRTSIPLRDELMNHFGLEDAQVLLSTSPDEALLSHVGALAARYIDRNIQEGMASTKGIASTSRGTRTIGISWGTSMLEMLKALRPRRRLPLNVVQLMGSVGTTALLESDGPEIARQLANAYGGRCYYLHAPLLVADSLVRNGLLQERTLRRSFQMMEQMDMALVGIGGARPEASGLFRAGYLGENELQVLRSQGAVGDICGWYFDINGRICDTEMLNRTIAVSLERLRSVPLVIAVAANVAKTEAILGALRTGIVKVLITDELCALAMLSHISRRELVESPD